MVLIPLWCSAYIVRVNDRDGAVSVGRLLLRDNVQAFTPLQQLHLTTG